jgi:phosphoglycerate dehydrogenase-like enzyme
MSKPIKAAMAALMRPLIEPHVEGLDVTWFASTDEALEIAPTVEIGWFDMFDKDKMAEIMIAATELKWLNTIYAGLESFPLEVLRERGIIVTNGAGIGAIPIAEYVIMGMLAAAKRIDVVLDNQREHVWMNDSPGVTELFEGNALIIGQGAIGSEIASRLAGFGMNITGVRRTPDKNPAIIGINDWQERLGEFDWIILAAPATTETQHLIGPAELAAMKTSAWIINIARGSLIDQPALIDALHSKAIGGAFLDTVYPEPLPSDDPLWDAPNTFITSHLSGRSQTRMFERAADRFIENLKRYRQQSEMIAVADLSLGY